MRRQARLTKSLNIKVSQTAYEQFEKLAGKVSVTEWARTILHERIEVPDPFQSAVMEAFAALRYVLFNALPWLAPVHLDSTEATRRPREVLEIEGLLRRLIEDAKQRKSKVDR